MKKIVVLLVAFAFAGLACAETPKAVSHAKPRPPLVLPAEKPVLLHTGKPITAEDKKHVVEEVEKAHSAKNTTKKTTSKTAAPQTTPAPNTLTPTLMFINNVGDAVGYGIAEFDAYDGAALFNTGLSGSMQIYVDVNPNTIYTMVFKVYTYGPNQKFNVTPEPPKTYPEPTNANTQILTTTGPNDNEFVYSFISDSTGQSMIMLTSQTPWEWNSVEISSTPLQ
jgi:hypothetical protein